MQQSATPPPRWFYLDVSPDRWRYLLHTHPPHHPVLVYRFVNMSGRLFSPASYPCNSLTGIRNTRERVSPDNVRGKAISKRVGREQE
jgi:hypothetical protein